MHTFVFEKKFFPHSTIKVKFLKWPEGFQKAMRGMMVTTVLGQSHSSLSSLHSISSLLLRIIPGRQWVAQKWACQACRVEAMPGHLNQAQ